MTSAADFPDDIDALKAMLMAAEAQIGVQNKTIDERDGIIERKEDRIIRLKKPEKGHPDQYHLALEDIETAMRRMKQLIPPPRRQARQSYPKDVAFCQDTCRALRK